MTDKHPLTKEDIIEAAKTKPIRCLVVKHKPCMLCHCCGDIRKRTDDE